MHNTVSHLARATLYSCEQVQLPERPQSQSWSSSCLMKHSLRSDREIRLSGPCEESHIFLLRQETPRTDNRAKL
jgi:hypothetical protein